VAETGSGGTGTRTILFTDLVGSTELRSVLGDVAADEVWREHDRLLRDAIARHGGVFAQDLGDGVMAVFESATDGCACAVAMQQGIGRLRRRRGVELSIRVGLSAGDVALDGDDWSGMPVVEAARLEAAAAGDQILASELVRLLAGTRTEASFEPVGELSLKGLASPVAACAIRWEPLSDVSVLPLPPALRASGFGFVGRESELDTLMSMWESARAGGVGGALVAGDAGIGKTRLAGEFAVRVHATGAIVLAGRCDEDLAVSYQPFVEALRYFVDRAPENLARRLGRYPGDLARLVPELADRVSDLPQPLRADPETERFRLFEAIVSWLGAASEDDSVLLVLEDLHWATKPTTLLVRHLLRSEGPARLLMVGTYRPTDLDRDAALGELLADLRRGGDAERINVEGLEEAGVAALLADALARPLTAAEADLAHRIRADTAGNAFFASEVVRHLDEIGLREDTVAIPDSVREVVGQRLARLSDDTNTVLAAAAVIGTEFDVALVSAVAKRSEVEVLDALEAATRARLLEEATLDQYRFAHTLVRATIYDGLSKSRRVRLHRLAADGIESLHADDLDEHVVSLARHLAEIAPRDPEAVGPAIDYASRAGAQALARLAPDDALHWYRQALKLLERTGDPDDARRGALLVGLGDAQRQTGEPAHRQTLLAAAELAQRLDDTGLLIRAVIANSRGMLSSSLQVDTERIAALEAARAATEDQLSRERALVLATLAAELAIADRARMRLLADEAIALAHRLGDDPTLVTVTTRMEAAVRAPDNLAQRCALADEAIAAAERTGDPVLRWYAATMNYTPALESGDIEAFHRRVDVVQHLAHEIGQPQMRHVAAFAQSLREALGGRLDESERTAALALEIGTNCGQPDAFLIYGGQLMAIRHYQGRITELVDVIEQAVAGNPVIPAYRAALADCYCEAGRNADAQALLEADAADRFSAFPFDSAWTSSMAMYARVAAVAGNQRLASRLVELLSPWRDQVATTGAMVFGSLAHSLALALATTGRFDEAEHAFAQATAANKRLGAPILLADTHLEFARFLLRRNRDNDRSRAHQLAHAALATAAKLGAGAIERGARALV
jgi:class 3 adenylate cyclase/tetratricopeptide (TPR) repeat protein